MGGGLTEFQYIYNKMTYIYLVENCYGDPNKVYIGKTKNSRKGPHKRKYGKNISYTIIDEIYSLDHKKWKPLEAYWIEQFRQWGFELMNINIDKYKIKSLPIHFLKHRQFQHQNHYRYHLKFQSYKFS